MTLPRISLMVDWSPGSRASDGAATLAVRAARVLAARGARAAPAALHHGARQAQRQDAHAAGQ